MKSFMFAFAVTVSLILAPLALAKATVEDEPLKIRFAIPEVEPGSCATVTVCLPGVKKGDVVEYDVNTTSTPGFIGAKVTAKDQVSVTICNSSRRIRMDEDSEAEFVVYGIIHKN